MHLALQFTSVTAHASRHLLMAACADVWVVVTATAAVEVRLWPWARSAKAPRSMDAAKRMLDVKGIAWRTGPGSGLGVKKD